MLPNLETHLVKVNLKVMSSRRFLCSSENSLGVWGHIATSSLTYTEERYPFIPHTLRSHGRPCFDAIKLERSIVSRIYNSCSSYQVCVHFRKCALIISARGK